MSSIAITDIIKAVKVTIDEIAINDAEFESGQDNTEMDTIIESKIPEALRFVYSNADWSLLDPDAVSSPTDGRYSIASGVGLYLLPDNFLRLVFAKFESWSRYLSQEDLILWNDKAYAMLGDTYATGTPARPKIALGWSGSTKRLELYSASGKQAPIDYFTGDVDCRIAKGSYVEASNTRLVKQGSGWYVYAPLSSVTPVEAICVVYEYAGTYLLKNILLTDFSKENIENEESDSFIVAYMTEPAKSGEAYTIPDKVYRAVIYYIAGLTLTTYREAQAAQLMFTEANDLMGFTAQASQQVQTQQ